MKTFRQMTILAASTLFVAACGSSNGNSATGGQVTRGAVTSKTAGAITVNGVALSTASAVVRVDDHPGGIDDVRPGDVVTVHGAFDDRTGGAAEIEVEHGIEGRVDDKGIDFLVIAGERIQVDDSTHFGDDHPNGLDSVFVGSVVMVSGAPVAGIPGAVDDKGGLRASRIDRSPRDSGAVAGKDDLDVKGFVSALDTGAKTFQLRATPEAARYWVVDYSGIALPAGVVNGAPVEVHALSAPAAGAAPVIGTIVASGIQLEDRLAGNDVEVEGYVTTISGSTFVVAGVTVETSGATRYELGGAADLVVGVKVEAEGLVDSSGVLHASRVSVRSGARITAVVQNYTGTAMTLLGVVVQLPSWLDDDLSVPLANGVKVEMRGNPTADGTGVVASRIVDPTGNVDRVFIRAVASAKSAGTQHLTVLGFDVDASSASLRNTDTSLATDRAAFFAAIEPGRTVVKVRAANATDVNAGAKTWVADEVEIEGHD